MAGGPDGSAIIISNEERKEIKIEAFEQIAQRFYCK